MELGSGIAIATACLSAAGVLITAIRSKAEPPQNGISGSNENSKHCSSHSGVTSCLESIERTMERHESWLKEIAGDVKEILKSEGNRR